MCNKTQSKTELDSILDLPPLCEMGDKDKDGTATFTNRADAECEGFGRWLLVGPDSPSPICDKHVAIIRERVGEDYLLQNHGVRIIPA